MDEKQIQQLHWKEFSKRVADTIKHERESRGIILERLAKDCGLSRQAIGFIELGKRKPSMQSVYRIVLGLGMTFPEFVEKLELNALKDEFQIPDDTITSQ